jgi:hypothetical protein
MSIWTPGYKPKEMSPDFPIHRAKSIGSGEWIEGQHFKEECQGELCDFIYSSKDGIVRWLVDSKTFQKIPKQMKLWENTPQSPLQRGEVKERP